MNLSDLKIFLKPLKTNLENRNAKLRFIRDFYNKTLIFRYLHENRLTINWYVVIKQGSK